MHYLLHLEDDDLMIEGVGFRIHDVMEFYKLIKSKNSIKFILTDAGYFLKNLVRKRTRRASSITV